MSMCAKEVGGAGPCQAMGCDWPECCGMTDPEEAPMTAKPVQIQRYSTRGYEDDFYPDDEGKWVTHADAEAKEQAALLQVRSLLEAKAKEWRSDECLNGLVVRTVDEECEARATGKCADELFALAATLGNQGK